MTLPVDSECAYCGQAEGHSRRCSVTRFGVKEWRMIGSKDRPRGPWVMWLGWRYRCFKRFGRVYRHGTHRSLPLGVLFIDWVARDV